MADEPEPSRPGRRRRRLVIAAVTGVVVLVAVVGLVVSRSTGDDDAVPADFLAEVDRTSGEGGDALRSLGLPATDLPEDATLAGPNFSVRFTATSSVAEIGTGFRGAVFEPDPVRILDLPLRPGPGREFLFIRTGDATTTEGAALAVHLVTQGSTRPLPRSVLTSETTTVITVPAGAEPALVVTDEGRTQSISLRTGRRGTDAIAAYHPTRRARAEFTEQALIGEEPDAVTASFQVKCGLALLPFEPGRGWAPDGQIWLVTLCEASVVGSGPLSQYLSGMSIDLSRVLTVRNPTGATLGPANSAPLELVGGDPNIVTTRPARMAVQAPAATSTVAVSLRLTQGRWRTVTPAPEVTVTF